MALVPNIHTTTTTTKSTTTTTSMQNADPRVLLGCLDPGRAHLADSAAGVHLRLRLGGAKWPPSLRWRLYSHHGKIIDMDGAELTAFSDISSQSCDRAEFNPEQQLCSDLWHEVRISRVSATMQQWRAALARGRVEGGAVHYPTITSAADKEQATKAARRQKMMRLYKRHHEVPAQPDALSEADMMAWCDSLGVDQYLRDTEALACTAGSDRIQAAA